MCRSFLDTSCTTSTIQRNLSLPHFPPVLVSLMLGRIDGHGLRPSVTVAKAKYGTEYYTKWAMLNTDGEMTWGPDAELTDAGVQQAKKTSDLWKGEFAEGMPLPTQLLCSPFTRTADTCKITFGDMMIGPGKMLHEMLGIRTGNKRGARTDLQGRFPDFILEDTMSEEDDLWKPDYRDT
ncbi:hypothetical protein FRB95_003038 [Tulasnella sp. JGI-2019a]|nr:hypothetical protein FRB95_003038 [Tulasnella sp. JGI-2019a]